ncbi:MAG: S-layer homology domain-containing protein, partial [Firmicutes bacterium]|nr:S-layer homology domain-containing protein [Bacillota bacterium]
MVVLAGFLLAYPPLAIGETWLDPVEAAAPDYIKDHWARTPLIDFYRMGIFTEYPSEQELRTPVNRGKFVTLLGDAYGLKSDDSFKSFNDLMPGSEVNGWAGALHRIGAIGGYPDGTFKPERELSRAEVVVILMRL